MLFGFMQASCSKIDLTGCEDEDCKVSPLTAHFFFRCLFECALQHMGVFWLLLHFNLTVQCNITCALLLRITVIMSKAPAAIPRRAHIAPHPSKARRIKVNYGKTKRAQLHCAMTSSIITTKYSCTGLVPESPTFFNSSPFKVLSPQPAKFLKSLLPVKEETKAKKLLEARPLLGQEVRSEELKSLFLKYLCFCCFVAFPNDHPSLIFHSFFKPHFCICQNTLHLHNMI